MKTVKEKEFDCVVYEPVKRLDNNNDDMNKLCEPLLVCRNYSGLYNRGNTCYLNSLLQTLFMTREFRMNILNWKYNEYFHGRREDSIPFQLQKLFARLQLRLRDSEITEELTKSFDWGHQQLLEQHDIQELCRVFFEAIENSLFESGDNFINELYQGSSSSIVKCLECQNESTKQDRFLDISLPVRDEYEKIYNTSLEMAFSNFLIKEKLQGENQYRCELCKKKVDALKYLKLIKLPKILFLQLNRFEYDVLTDGRRKICDRVTFPAILNMNPFMKDYDQIKKRYTTELLKHLESRNLELINNNDNNFIQEYLNEGEYVYELYAVVVHSGSARGGHYFSYIKSFDDDKWYRFDDSSVYEANLKNIENTFGENTKTGLNAVTGYILKYRQISNAEADLKISKSIPNSLITNDLMNIIEKENILILEEEERQKDKLNTLQLKFIYDDKIANVIVKKTNTIAELKAKLMREYSIENLTEKNVRIRSMNQTFKLLDAYSEEYKTLDEAYFLSHKTYALEIKKENEEFEEFNPNMIILNLCKWDDKFILENIEEKDFKFEKIKIDKKRLLSEFKNILYEFYKISNNSEVYVIKKVEFGMNNYQVTELFNKEEDLNKDLTSLLLTENSKLFLEIKCQNWEGSKFIKFFEDNSANIIVKFNVPVILNTTSNNSNGIILKKVSKILFNSYKFDNQIEIKKSKTLSELKKKISEMINIPDNQFIIKKNSHNGVELKNLSDTVDKFTNNTLTIYTEYGSPQKDSEIKINLFTCEYDLSFFLVFPYKTVDSGFFLVDLNWNIAQLKKFLISELEKKSVNLNYLDINEILLREYKNGIPTKIFEDNLILGKDLLFSENRKLIIQKYTESILNINPGDIQVTIREWIPSNWKISSPIEFHFHKGLTFMQFAHKVQELFPHLSPDRISAFKVLNEMNVYMDDFKKYKFENLYAKDDFVLDAYPFFVNTDGCILIIKNDESVLREPTLEEVRILCRPKLNMKNRKSISSTSSIASCSSTGSKISNNKSFYREKEKGVIIKVKNGNGMIKDQCPFMKPYLIREEDLKIEKHIIDNFQSEFYSKEINYKDGIINAEIDDEKII